MVTVAEAVAQAGGALQNIDREAGSDAVYNDGKWGDPRSASYGYWRKPDGFLTFHENGHNTLGLLQRGWTMLPTYGVDQLSAGRRNWNPHNDPWRMLVDRNGIKEMPVEQLKALRFHRRPTRNATYSHKKLWEQVDALVRTLGCDEPSAVEEIMPQLRGTDWRDWQDWPCELCPGRAPFNSEANLKGHQSVMHPENVRETVMQKAIAGALERSGEQSAAANAEVIGLLAQAVSAIAEQSKEHQAAILTLLERVGARPVKDTRAK